MVSNVTCATAYTNYKGKVAEQWKSIMAVKQSWGTPPATHPPTPLNWETVRFRVLTSLTSVPAQVTPHCGINKRQPAGLHTPHVPMCLRRGRATSVQHRPISQDGLSPGAIIQQCNVYWTQSSSNYVNGSEGTDRPFRLNCGVELVFALLSFATP